MKIEVVQQPKMGRKIRSPKHQWSLRTRPWQIQPFMIAPVQPGETMSNLLHQSRVVTDPIKSPLVGWWVEYYYYYIKHRDLDPADKLVEMHLNANEDMTTVRSAAASVPYYTYAGGMDYVRLCLKRVVEEDFRAEGEAWDAFAIDGVPLAHINNNSWMDSLKLASTTAVRDDEMPGEVSTLPFGVDPAWSAYYAQWEHMVATKLTDATFEDYLRQWGIKTPEVQEEENAPELIRYFRDWSYPSNTINPADGAPSSAVSWTVAERADKDRFFKEPGFVFGVQVVRPKVFLSAQKGGAVGALDNAYAWLPPAVMDQGYTSLKNFANNAGPLSGVPGEGYWFDLRDLYLYGDQFVNYDLVADGTGSHVVLPTATLQTRYASAAHADALFRVPATNKIRADGVTSLGIKGRVTELT